MNKESIQEALKAVKYPGFSRDIVSFGLIRSIEVVDGKAAINVAVATSDHSIPAKIRDDIENTVSTLEGIKEVAVNISVTASKQPAAASTEPKAARIDGVKHVIAVASGKGGVGKSTFAVNLAGALSKILEKDGKKVGLMDCDIYGPSIPLMFGVKGRPFVEGDSLIPLENHGVKVMSMGFLIDDNAPVVWRGPMIMKTIQQFIQNVKWGELEIIVIDLPPGTGDAQLSLVQNVELSGALLVTTPQPAATQVAIRGAKMLEKTNVPILGVAENMSYFVDPQGNRTHIFGEGGGQQTALELSTQLLGQIPLDQEIRHGGDLGTPISIGQPDSIAGKEFHKMANAVLEQLQ
ncbi:Mrp/NBP35 family ATP-binding protein [Puniceicoccaceae bacterium K14]|nr:Mrp/NBP35 family ATP-binding protein [Puniceicoccaceae bacterium K14]